MPAELPEWVPAARRAVGDRIRVRRLHQNMTQESLAHAAGVDRSTVQRMEAGHEMKLSHLLLVAHALRTHVTDLLHG
ncbi:helix-turn-helix transcriptional regulator [Streptomyces sp. NPDC058947]|uniref:helix-turn-helix transcriptional regulator n=1 Tax=Streptomyces sp. NPDC058947 TaxID=3346675 RepID=UPI0036775046